MRLEFPTVAWANIFATLVANGFSFFFGINKRRTQTKQTKETASLTNDHKQREGEIDRESEQREQAPLHLMSYRERAFAHAHTHSDGQNIVYTVFSTEKNN